MYTTKFLKSIMSTLPEITPMYIFSQICVIFGMLFLALSFFNKDKKKIMILCIFNSIFYGIQYLLLGSITGFVMNVVSIIRNMFFYFNAKKKRKNSVYFLILLYLFAIILGIITYENVYSILPIAATLIFTYSVWQDKTKVYRWLAVFVSLSWIYYNYIVGSLFAFIQEIILLIVEIIGVAELYVVVSKRKNKRNV